MPLAPRLLQTGASWVELEWSRPSSYGPDEVLTYTLEMQDETKVTHTHTHTQVLTCRFCLEAAAFLRFSRPQ